VNQPLRVAMIGPFGLAPKGTMAARALPLARALAAGGHQVQVLMPPWHTPEEADRTWEQDRVTLRYVPLGPGRGTQVPGVAATVGRLVREALRGQPDVVHCFKPKGHAGLAGWVLHQLGMLRSGRKPRLVVDEDDWEGPGGWNEMEPYSKGLRAWFAWQERWGLTHCQAVTVSSRALQTIVWSMGVPPAHVHYVPNGSNGLADGDGGSVRQRLGLGTAPTVLLYTRFAEFDPARAVRVYAAIRRQVPEARLLVVGTALHAQGEARFRSAVEEHGLAAGVVDVGWAKTPDLPGYLATADLAIYPFDDTLVNRTKCPAKLADLLAAGVPVVADAVGQCTEYISQGDDGLCVPAGDMDAMVTVCVRLLRDASLRKRLGEAAAIKMRKEYAWDVLAERVLAAYARGG
jgi:glycosyltransferase involved in cell wall biosynthesis